MQPRGPEGLVRVDVADAGDQPLVQQGPFDPGPAGAQPPIELSKEKRGSSGSRAMCAASAGSAAAPVSDQPPGPVAGGGRSARNSPPKMRWSTKRSSSGMGAVVAGSGTEPETNLQVLFVRLGAILDEQLAAHAQMGHQGQLRLRLERPAAASVQRHPQELAAAGHVHHTGPNQVAAQVSPNRGRGGAPSAGQGLSTAGDGTAADPAGQAAADHLDLGQFRHG